MAGIEKGVDFPVTASDGFSGTFDKLKTQVGSAGAGLERFKAQATAAFAGISVAGLASLMKGAIETMDHLGNLSKATNIAVETLSGLSIAAKQSGGDLDGIAASINKLAVNMGKDAERFKQLGITAKDPLEAFKQLSDVFVSIRDPQLRAAVAAEALGKSWASAAPLLAEGGKRIGEMVDRGSQLSGVTAEGVRQAKEFNDKWVELVGTGGLLIRVVTPILPLLNQLADNMLRARDYSKDLGTSFSPLLELMKALLVLGANVNFVFQTMGKEFARAAENIKLIAKGDFAGSRALGEVFRKDAEASRIALDKWTDDVMKIGTASTTTAGVVGSADSSMTDSAIKAAAARARAFLGSNEAINKDAERLRKLDLDGWVRYAQGIFDAADEENRALAKISEEHWANEDRLRELDNAGWVKYIEAQADEYERGLKELGDAQPSFFEASQKQWNGFLDGIEGGFREVWTAFGNNAKHAGQVARDVLKRTLFDWIYQAFAKPIILQFVASAAGMLGMSGLANAAAGAASGDTGGVGGLLSAGSSAYTLGTAAVSGYGSFVAGAQGATLAAGMAGPTTAGATGLTGLGASLAPVYEALASIPVWGWIAMAVIAIGAWIAGNHKGGPKFGGSFMGDFDSSGNFVQSSAVPGTDNGRFFTPDQMDATLKPLVVAAANTAASTITRLGGTSGGFSVGLGVDNDPNGTAQSRVSAMLRNAQGGILYQNINQNMDDKAVPEALRLESERMVVAAIKSASDTLDPAIAAIFADIDPLTASFEQLDAAIKKALEIKSVIDALGQLNANGLDITALQAWQREGESISQTFQRVAGQFASFDDAFMTDAQKVAAAQTAVTGAFGKLGIAIPESTSSFYDLVHGLDLSTQSGRDMFDALMAVAPAFLTVQNAAASAVSTFNSLASSLSPAFGRSNSRSVLEAAVQAWMNLNPANQHGWTVESTIQNIGSIISSGNLGQALTYAQSLGGDAVSTLNSMLSAYSQWTQAMNDSTSSASSFANTVNDASSGLADLAQQAENVRKGISDWLDKTLLGPMSTLSPEEQLAFAQRQYQDNLTRAQGGDIQALSSYTNFADAYLQAARSYFASSPDFAQIFNQVTAQGAGLAGRPVDWQQGLMTALPLNSKMASQADIQQLVQVVRDYLGAVASGNAAAVNQQNTILKSLPVSTASAIDATARR